MRKSKIKLYQCMIGDIIAENIYSANGALIVCKATIMNDYILNKLSGYGIDYVHIYKKNEISSLSDCEGSYSRLTDDYHHNVQELKNILKNIVSGKSVDFKQINNISKNIISEVNQKKHIIKCLTTIKDYDEHIYNHSVNVALYNMLIGIWLGLPKKQVQELIITGLMHDVGKAKIPGEIINKKGKLTKEEFEIIKKHSTYGYEVIKENNKISKDILDGVLMHHEKEDGTGYPFKLCRNEIPLFAKITALSDVYDALTSERAYKKRLTPFSTFEIIQRTGFGHFDTKIMMTFLNNIASYYIGVNVRMNTGEIGKVVYVVPHNLGKPIVHLNDDYIDLSLNKNIKIVEVIE